VRLVSLNKMKLSGLFTYQFALKNINLALGAIRSGEAGRELAHLID